MSAVIGYDLDFYPKELAAAGEPWEVKLCEQLETGELRPAVSDLKLVTVIYDPAGRSVAILRDLTTKEQYRIKVGQTLGRMRDVGYISAQVPSFD